MIKFLSQLLIYFNTGYMKKNKLEILAPAGDLEKLKIAFQYGADAVYAGVPEFGMRVKEIGFNLKSLAEGIKYTHKIGKKIYVTVNIFAHNRDLKLLPNFLKKLEKIKPDALIVADPGVLGIIEDLKLKIPIHISTQANVINWRAVKFWLEKVKNIERVILARELSWQEIKEINRKLPGAEIEFFVHGAMCMSYSGRCNISNYLTGRDANQGDCAQSCRWQYRVWLEETNRPGELMSVEEDQHGSYFFNSRDLCLIHEMEKIISTGAVSLKIEGRNKSIYYVARVVSLYRQAMDLFWDEKNKYKRWVKTIDDELSSITSRGYTTGFFLGDDGQRVDYGKKKYVKSKDFVGLILGQRGKRVKVEARNQIKNTDRLDVMLPDGTKDINIKKFDIGNGQMVEVVNTNQIFYFNYEGKLPVNGMIRIKRLAG